MVPCSFFQGFCLSNVCVSGVICKCRHDLKKTNQIDHDPLQHDVNSPGELQRANYDLALTVVVDVRL